MVIFQTYPNLKHRGGAEKLVLSISSHMAQENEVYILSEDANPDIPAGVKHLYVPLKTPYKIPFALIQLRRLIKQYKPDVVHSHHRMTTMLLSLLRNVKPFTLLHTAHNTFFDKKLFSKSKADKYIAVGKEVENNLLDYFDLPPSKVTTIINGVPKVEINESEKSSLKNTAIVVGRLSEQKGHTYLIDAWQKVVSEKPEAQLIILGDGELRSELEKQVKETSLQSNIHFKGFQANVTDWINQCEFVILPSLWEGLPLTILEAFSAHKTVVATAVDGTKEIVLDRETGLLVASRNPEALSKAILELFNSPELISEMEDKAYQAFLDNYTLDRMLENYKTLINEMAK